LYHLIEDQACVFEATTPSWRTRSVPFDSFGHQKGGAQSQQMARNPLGTWCQAICTILCGYDSLTCFLLDKDKAVKLPLEKSGNRMVSVYDLRDLRKNGTSYHVCAIKMVQGPARWAGHPLGLRFSNVRCDPMNDLRRLPTSVWPDVSCLVSPDHMGGTQSTAILASSTVDNGVDLTLGHPVIMIKQSKWLFW